MTDRISSGTMLLEDGTAKPGSLQINISPYLNKWSSITALSSSQLSRLIEAAGWTFFYMADTISRRGFGFRDESRTAHALAKVTVKVKEYGCNCLEVTKLRRGSVLGISYVSVTAHARHIQESRSFCKLSGLPARIPLTGAECLYGQAFRDKRDAVVSFVGLQSRENEGGSLPNI